MNSEDFSDKHKLFDITGWEMKAQNLQVPELPFDLHVTIDLESAVVDPTEAYGSLEHMFLELSSTAMVLFREDGIVVAGNHLPKDGFQPGAIIKIGIVAIARGTLPACMHGFEPASMCPACGQTFVPSTKH